MFGRGGMAYRLSPPSGSCGRGGGGGMYAGIGGGGGVGAPGVSGAAVAPAWSTLIVFTNNGYGDAPNPANTCANSGLKHRKLTEYGVTTAKSFVAVFSDR